MLRNESKNLPSPSRNEREAASRAESDTRAIRVELASYEKQQFSIQQEINAQITLQKELANHLPQLEEHEAQLVERTQEIETRRIELEKKQLN